MRSDLEQKLLNEFPNLYKQYNCPPMETNMCWGFDHGDGWFDIVYNLSKAISEINPQCEVSQVKEKFGGLRFYVDNGSEEVYNLICKAEDESLETCEFCGSKDDVKLHGKSWIQSLCKKCRDDWDHIKSERIKEHLEERKKELENCQKDI